MTDEQISLVKKSWKIFREIDPTVIGDVFYSKLFVKSPHVKHLFKTSKSEQSKKLIEMINMIIGRLDRLNEITEEIKQLAVRHVQYGVKPAHYILVGDALLWTLQQGLGNDWTPDVEEAWVKCYTTLSDTMIAASTENTRS